jgi:hypothetical protein
VRLGIGKWFLSEPENPVGTIFLHETLEDVLFSKTVKSTLISESQPRKKYILCW